MANQNLVIFNGPTAAGKSSVAKLVQHHAPAKIAYFDHDYAREVIFSTSKKESKNVRKEMLVNNVCIALNGGFDVLIDSTLTKNRLLEVINSIDILKKGSINIYVFYLEVSLNESKKRHLAREKSKAFDVSSIEKWYPNFAKLGWDNELVLEQALSEQDKAYLVIKQVYGG